MQTEKLSEVSVFFNAIIFISERRRWDIIRIFAEPFAYNKASCRILEKAGFQFEGVLRNNAVKDGKVLDMHMYSLIRQPE